MTFLRFWDLLIKKREFCLFLDEIGIILMFRFLKMWLSSIAIFLYISMEVRVIVFTTKTSKKTIFEMEGII